VPIPIQSGSLSDRLRRFFRIRGKTSFVLDEVVAPVVIVQDLTKGPYQAGVTPCAGGVTAVIVTPASNSYTMAIILNDKPGSVTEFLPDQFNNRTFSATWFEMQNQPFPATLLGDVNMILVPRAEVFAAGIPDAAAELIAMQSNDGSLKVPVQMFTFPVSMGTGSKLWRGILGDNTNTLGSRRTFDPEPNVTIGKDDALVVRFDGVSGITASPFLNVRGFYQEQPA